MRTIFLDGQYLKVDAQIIEAFTPGVFKAKGVFETMLGLDGVVLDASLHLKRLRTGLKILGINPPSFDPLILKEVFGRNQLSYGRVRLMVWEAGPAFSGAGKQVHVMVAAIAQPVPHKRKYRVCLVKTDRMAHDRWANVKSLDYEAFSQAFAHARDRGFDEALLLNRRGFIFEASRSNIFWIKDDILYTPPLSSGCLNGITRQQVIKQAQNFKISVKESNLTLQILKASDAAFLTNSLLGIKPIEMAMINNLSID